MISGGDSASPNVQAFVTRHALERIARPLRDALLGGAARPAVSGFHVVDATPS